MKKVGLFMLGTFIGAWFAGVLVLLFTPMSGKDIREKITTETQKIVDDVKTASDLRQKELKQELDTFRQGKAIKLESSD